MTLQPETNVTSDAMVYGKGKLAPVAVGMTGITFDREPPLVIITALKEAGFTWDGDGTWVGKAEACPAIVERYLDTGMVIPADIDMDAIYEEQEPRRRGDDRSRSTAQGRNR